MGYETPPGPMGYGVWEGAPISLQTNLVEAPNPMGYYKVWVITGMG
jgi:hypothetical protein